MGSIPVRVTKKETSELFGSDVSFYPSRRLGMESRVSVYGIAIGAWHHRRCIFCGLIPYATASQFHSATSCGFHTSLRDDYMLAFGEIWYEGARIVVRIPRSKIEELALQAQSAGILTLGVKIHLFYPSRRLGMASRSGVYGIAEGVWHHQRCILPAS